jgi:hypothetical protein
MQSKSYTDMVRLALKQVAQDRKVTQAAKDTGLTTNMLYGMISRGSLNTDATVRIHDWLVKHGYIPGNPVPVKLDKSDPLKVMAGELRALADVLDSEYARELRSKLAIDWIVTTVKNAESIVSILRKNL